MTYNAFCLQNRILHGKSFFKTLKRIQVKLIMVLFQVSPTIISDVFFSFGLLLAVHCSPLLDVLLFTLVFELSGTWLLCSRKAPSQGTELFC